MIPPDLVVKLIAFIVVLIGFIIRLTMELECNFGIGRPWVQHFGTLLHLIFDLDALARLKGEILSVCLEYGWLRL